MFWLDLIHFCCEMTIPMLDMDEGERHGYGYGNAVCCFVYNVLRLNILERWRGEIEVIYM